MGWYKVREGQELGHNGKTLVAGDILELPPHVATEVAEKVVACTKEGEILATEGEANFDRAAGHERISILEQQVEAARKTLEDAEARLAAERDKPKPEAPPDAHAEAHASIPVSTVGPAVTSPDPISTARPVEPNQEVGHDKGPDPISTAAKRK